MAHTRRPPRCCGKADLLPDAASESCCALGSPLAHRGCRPSVGQSRHQRGVVDAASAKRKPVLDRMICNKTPSARQTLRARGPLGRALSPGFGSSRLGPGRLRLEPGRRGRQWALFGSESCHRHDGPAQTRRFDVSSRPPGIPATVSCWAPAGRRVSYESAVTVLVLSGELQLPFRGSLAGGVSRIKLTVPSIFPGELQLPLLRGSAGCFGCTGGCRESKATPKAPPFAMFTMAPLSTPPSRLHGLCPVRMRAPAFCLLFTGRTGCPLKVVSVQLPRILTVRLDSPPNPRHAEPSHLYLSTA